MMTRRDMVGSVLLAANSLPALRAMSSLAGGPLQVPAQAHPGSGASSAATDPKGPTGMLSTWLATTRLEDVPHATQERARHLILDGICCLLVGTHLPWSEIGVRAMLAADPWGRSLIAGWEPTTSPTTAAMLNSSFIQGFELDDVFAAAPFHANSVILPALMSAMPLRSRVTGRDFLLGTILGYETGSRVGLALHGGQMLSRGWHSGVVFGGPAAAASLGPLYGFSAGTYEDALGIAATQACGLMSAQYESMVKRMQHGFASRNGFTASVLAAGGYVGIKRVFEREYGGFLSVFGEGHSPDPAQIGEGLGTTWNTDSITVKPYAAMAGLHAGIDAAKAIRAQRPIDPDKVQSVLVEVGDANFQHGGFVIQRPIEPVAAQMSLQYTVPVALLDGAAMVAQYSPARINRDDVWALVSKTRVEHVKEFDTAHSGLETRVTITYKDGTSDQQVVTSPLGSKDRLLSNQDVVNKYQSLTANIIDKGRSDQILNFVLGLDKAADAGKLLLMLKGPVRNPLR